MTVILRNGCSEGECSKLCKLEALLTEGDTDNGDAPDDSREEEAKPKAKAAEDKPENVAESFH